MSQEKMKWLSASEYHSHYRRVTRFLFTEGDSITVLFFHLRPIGESVSSGKAFLNMLNTATKDLSMKSGGEISIHSKNYIPEVKNNLCLFEKSI